MGHHELKFPPGANINPEGIGFRVWAPQARTVEVVFEDEPAPAIRLESGTGGYFTGLWRGGRSGACYRYRLDGGEAYPDPWSRFQPEGPFGPSLIVDPRDYTWRDRAWRGLTLPGQVLYELHIGAFTPEGSFDAAARELPRLAGLGITCLEIMPVVEFPGRFNWGYDGVNLFAPFHRYGDPHAFRRFVDVAHSVGLGVILDVVYNHIGPDGNFLACFSRDYFTDRYPNEWGDAINFDGPGSGPVRELFIGNAAYWIREFHLDGLRLDATQSIFDATRPHVIAEIVSAARAAAAPRKILMIAENEPQQTWLLDPPERDGAGLDAMWNDDFHRSAHVALTLEHDGYFHDYRGTAQELLSAVRHNFLFQGQRSLWQKKSRGTPALRRDAKQFITYTQNHDQVANTLNGKRLHELTGPGRSRAMTALHLLAPQTPLIFMGQEFAAPTPFCFFADHRPELAEQVWRGRREFLKQFEHFATDAARATVPDPADPRTFHRSRLNADDLQKNRATLDLYRDLLKIRRSDPVISRQSRGNLDGAVLSERALLLRWTSEGDGDRLLVVNLGARIDALPPAEPLLAPPAGSDWQMLWSSDDVRYGGSGALNPCEPEGWRVAAESATLLMA